MKRTKKCLCVAMAVGLFSFLGVTGSRGGELVRKNYTITAEEYKVTLTITLTTECKWKQVENENKRKMALELDPLPDEKTDMQFIHSTHYGATVYKNKVWLNIKQDSQMYYFEKQPESTDKVFVYTLKEEQPRLIW